MVVTRPKARRVVEIEEIERQNRECKGGKYLIHFLFLVETDSSGACVD